MRDLYRGKDDLPSPAQQIKTSSHSQRPVDRHTSTSPHFSSADSPLLTSTTHQPSPEKAFTKPFAPTSSEDIRVGMEVLVTRSRGQIGRGKVKFVGQLPGKDEAYVGLELRRGEGMMLFVVATFFCSFISLSINANSLPSSIFTTFSVNICYQRTFDVNRLILHF